MNKNSEVGRVLMPMTHWAIDLHFEGIIWDWVNDTRPFCLKPNDTTTEIGAMTPKELEIAQKMHQLWTEWQKKDESREIQ